MTDTKEAYRHAMDMEPDLLDAKYLVAALVDLLEDDKPAAATVARHGLGHIESVHRQWQELIGMLQPGSEATS